MEPDGSGPSDDDPAPPDHTPLSPEDDERLARLIAQRHGAAHSGPDARGAATRTTAAAGAAAAVWLGGDLADTARLLGADATRLVPNTSASRVMHQRMQDELEDQHRRLAASRRAMYEDPAPPADPDAPESTGEGPAPAERPHPRAQWDERRGTWILWDVDAGAWTDLTDPADGPG